MINKTNAAVFHISKTKIKFLTTLIILTNPSSDGCLSYFFKRAHNETESKSTYSIISKYFLKSRRIRWWDSLTIGTGKTRNGHNRKL